MSWMCRRLGVSTSGYYAWQSRQPSARTVANALVLAQIRELRRGHAKNYGGPRVFRGLRAQGIAIGRHRVARFHDIERDNDRIKNSPVIRCEMQKMVLSTIKLRDLYA